jgi:hypothetical protein
MGVPIDGPTCMFGDNQSWHHEFNDTAFSAWQEAKHVSCHRCREVIAAGVSKTFHMDGKHDLSNVMTKCLAHSDRRSWVAKAFRPEVMGGEV